MAYRKAITAAERRHRDYLRRRTLRVASVYEVRLEKDRRKELRRVLAMAKDYEDPEVLIQLIEGEIDEAGYLGKWWQGLYTTVGVPMAKTTASELRAMKAADEDDLWLGQLRRYATTRAGNEIVIVSGTWKDSLVKLVRKNLQDDPTIGIEKLTRNVYDGYVGDLEKWMCRRIAQTEAMIGMADASDLAAESLEIPFTKQWCISGLGNTRESHEAMDGVIVDQDEPFVLPGGLMMYPHDTDLNASASEIINCACDCIRRPKNSTATDPIPAQAAEAPTELSEDDEKRVLALMEGYPADIDEATRRAMAANDLMIEKKLGIKKGAPMTIEKADKQHANPNWSAADREYQVNCATTAPTFALREKGFDVIAKGCVQGSGSLNDKASHTPWELWRNADGTKAKPHTFMEYMKAKEHKTMTSKMYWDFLDEYCKEQGTYELVLDWSRGGGHATIIKRLPDGSLVGVEPQKYWDWRGETFKLDITVGTMSSKPSFQCGVMKLDDKLVAEEWIELFGVKKK